jgi:hypothetical protein
LLSCSQSAEEASLVFQAVEYSKLSEKHAAAVAAL